MDLLTSRGGFEGNLSVSGGGYSIEPRIFINFHTGIFLSVLPLVFHLSWLGIGC